MDTAIFNSIDDLMAVGDDDTLTADSSEAAADASQDTRDEGQGADGDEGNGTAGDGDDAGEGAEGDAQSQGTDGDGSDEPDAGDEPGVPKFLAGAFEKLANATTEESRKQIEGGIRAEFVKMHTEGKAAQEAKGQWDGLVSALEKSPETAKAVLRHVLEQTAQFHKADASTFLALGDTDPKASGASAAAQASALSMSDDEFESFVDENDLSTGEAAVAKAFNERLRSADSAIQALLEKKESAPAAQPSPAPPAAPAAGGYQQVAKEIKASRSGFALTEQDYNDSIKNRPGLSPIDAVQLHMADKLAAHMAEAGRKTAPKGPLMPSGSNQTGKGSGVKPVRSVNDLLDMAGYGDD